MNENRLETADDLRGLTAGAWRDYKIPQKLGMEIEKILADNPGAADSEPLAKRARVDLPPPRVEIGDLLEGTVEPSRIPLAMLVESVSIDGAIANIGLRIAYHTDQSKSGGGGLVLYAANGIYELDKHVISIAPTRFIEGVPRSVFEFQGKFDTRFKTASLFGRRVVCRQMNVEGAFVGEGLALECFRVALGSYHPAHNGRTWNRAKTRRDKKRSSSRPRVAS